MEKKLERRNEGNRNSFFMKDRRENSGREARGDNNREMFDRNGENNGRRRSFNPNFDRNNRPRYNRRDNEANDAGQGFRERNYNREFRNDRNNDYNRNDRRFSQGGREFREGNRRNDGYRERDFNREIPEREDYNRNRRPYSSGRRESFRPEFRERDYNREDNRNNWERRPFRSENRGNARENFRNESHKPNYRREAGYDDRRPRRPRRVFDGNTQRVGYQGRDRDEQLHGTVVSNFMEPLLNREIRLNRYIAMSGICSRREADEYIRSGVVSVNGSVVTELGTKVKAGDEVCFNDEVIRGERKVYIVLNKPKGYVTTMDDPNAEHTVMDLLQNKVEQRIYPVGRLDKNTMGVLLLTNDGDLAKELTHPSYMKKKVYQVFLDKKVEEADMERLVQGVELEDGPAYVDEISYVGESRKEVGVEIHSGRNRIVRRLFETLGYRVQKLDRVYFAGLTKKGLQRGMWRYLTGQEISMLKSGGYQ